MNFWACFDFACYDFVKSESIFIKGCNLLPCRGYSVGDIVTCQLHMGTGGEAYAVCIYCDITISHVPGCQCAQPYVGVFGLKFKGDMIEELIFQHGLMFATKALLPPLGRGTSTIIDITLCASGMLEYKSGWKVDTKGHLSDHRRITFRLDLEAQAQPSQVWATKKADWCKFSTLMGDRSSNFRPHRFWTAKIGSSTATLSTVSQGINVLLIVSVD